MKKTVLWRTGEVIPLLPCAGHKLMTDISTPIHPTPPLHPTTISITKHNRRVLFFFPPNKDLNSIIQIRFKGRCPQICIGLQSHMAKCRFSATSISLPLKGENILLPVLSEASMGFKVFLLA